MSETVARSEAEAGAIQADSATKARKKSQARSRVTNGNKLLPGVDGRSVWARRLSDVMDLYASDMGGNDRINESQRSIIRRAATMTVELEQLEAAMSKGDRDSLDAYQRTAGQLRRLLESVGLAARLPTKAAQELERRDSGLRITRDALDSIYGADPKMLLLTHDGDEESAKREAARRIAFAIEKAVANGEPISEGAARIAQWLDDRIRVVDQNGDTVTLDRVETPAAPQAVPDPTEQPSRDDIPASDFTKGVL